MYDKKKGHPYYTNRHICFLLQYHMVLVTKYRHPVLTGGVKDLRFREPPVPLASEPGERRSRLMSFIPSREEANDILLIGPLRKLTEREENDV